MFKVITINPSELFVGQAAMRGAASAAMFNIINAITNQIRKGKLAIPEEDEISIDAFNEEHAAKGEEGQEEENLEEQGYESPQDPIEVAKLLKEIYNHIWKEMEGYARKERSELNHKVLIPFEYDVPQTAFSTLERQARPRYATPEKIERQYRQYEGSVSREELIAADRARQDTNTGFIRLHSKEILDEIKNLHWTGEPMDHWQCFDALRPILQLRLLSGADQALVQAKINIIKYPRGKSIPEQRGDFKLLEEKRIEILKEVDHMMMVKSFVRRLDADLERGATVPQFIDIPKISKIA